MSPARQLLLVLVLLAAAALPARASEPVELAVKAAYLYKFATYAEWPPGAFDGPDSPFVIGVAGSEAAAELLQRLVAGRAVGGHPVEVRRITRGMPLDGVHMLYASGGRAAIGDILEEARGNPVLTVTDSDQAFAQGGMINFVIADNKLRFEVALRRVNTGRLRISARMLAAAHRVETRIPI
ncbi:YfiR family protein [Pseudoduganella sp. GCM10020061]|uniref:YfiR family protein n=1 Tax=Pseudoduganella sp. GCM10020061 TaxID=3317345 RepID=UPI00362A6800